MICVYVCGVMVSNTRTHHIVVLANAMTTVSDLLRRAELQVLSCCFDSIQADWGLSRQRHRICATTRKAKRKRSSLACFIRFSHYTALLSAHSLVRPSFTVCNVLALLCLAMSVIGCCCSDGLYKLTASLVSRWLAD